MYDTLKEFVVVIFSALSLFCRIAVDQHVGNPVCCDWVITFPVDVL